MGTFGGLWGPMGAYGGLLAPLGTFWGLWGPMGACGGLWGPMGTYGGLWGSMGTYGHLLWGGVGGGGARTIIEGVASTGWVSDARVETTTHFYTSKVW